MRTEELTKLLFEALDDEVSKCISLKGELSERSLELLEIAQERNIGRSAALHWLEKSGE